jgi:hypothetical protein
MLNFVENEKGRMIVIDSLNGYRKAMQSGNMLELQLHATGFSFPQAAREGSFNRWRRSQAIDETSE